MSVDKYPSMFSRQMATIVYLLDVLVCSMAVYFCELCCILASLRRRQTYFGEPVGRVGLVKIQTTSTAVVNKFIYERESVTVLRARVADLYS